MPPLRSLPPETAPSPQRPSTSPEVSFPFGACRSRRQVILELPPPGSRHVGFLTFLRLALRLVPFQPCFMLVAPLGLRPSEVFPLEQPVTSRCQSPPAVPLLTRPHPLPSNSYPAAMTLLCPTARHRRSLPEGRLARRRAHARIPKNPAPNKRLPRLTRMAVPISGTQHKHHEVWIPTLAGSAMKNATCRTRTRSRSADRQRARGIPRVALAAARCLHPKMKPHGLHAAELPKPKLRNEPPTRRHPKMATLAPSGKVDGRWPPQPGVALGEPSPHEGGHALR